MLIGWEIPDDEPRWILDVSIEYDVYQVGRVADAIYIENRGPTAYSEEQMNAYREMIQNVYGVIDAKGFPILNQKQSGDSIAYYIDFKPIDENGDEMDIVRVRFRIAEHDMHGNDSLGEHAVFKNFQVGTKKYPDPFALVLGVEKTCEAIQRGDKSMLMRY